MWRKIKPLISIVIGLLFLYFAFRKVDFGDVGNAIADGNYLYFILAFVLGGLGFILRAYRWKVLIKPVKEIDMGDSFIATTIGFMANGILPMRLGEVIRAYVLGQRVQISKSAVFATIIVERIFDIFVLLFVFSMFLLVVQIPFNIKRLSLILFLIGFTIVILMVILVLKPDIFVRILNFFPARFVDKLRRFSESFIEGLRILKNGKLLLYVTFLSILLWSYIAYINYNIFKVLGIELPYYAAFIVVIVISLGISLPSAPGFVGTFHFFAVLGLSIFDISKDIAFSFAILSHLIAFIPVVIIGFFSLQKYGLPLRQIRETKK